MSQKKHPLSPDELDAIMPDGDLVHTFISGGIAIIGCDMDRSKILHLAKLYGAELAGEQATAMKHGAAVYDENGKPIFVETKLEESQ